MDSKRFEFKDQFCSADFAAQRTNKYAVQACLLHFMQKQKKSCNDLYFDTYVDWKIIRTFAKRPSQPFEYCADINSMSDEEYAEYQDELSDRFKNEHQYSRDTIIKFCLSLDLSLAESYELMHYSGYTFSAVDERDNVILQCIAEFEEQGFNTEKNVTRVDYVNEKLSAKKLKRLPTINEKNDYLYG